MTHTPWPSSSREGFLNLDEDLPMLPMIQDPLALLALISGLVALAFWLEGRFDWARKASASLLIILGGAILSNLDMVPAGSPVYDAITGPVTSLAIVWLLFAVDLRGLRAAGPRMLMAFALAVVGTSIGALVASLLLSGSLGDDTWRLAGVMTGTYAGGSVNFASVSREVEIAGSLLAASTAADNVLTAVWVGATLMLPVWLAGPFRRRARPGSERHDGQDAQVDTENPFEKEVTLRPVSLLSLLAVGLLLVLLSGQLHAWIPQVPSVLWLTSLALVLAQAPWIRRLEGTMQLGLIALNLFFAVIGIWSRFSEIFREGPSVFYFTVIVVMVHGLVIYGGAWLLRLDVESTSVASQAAIGGPSTALALAVSRGWSHLNLPGVMVGLLGYAVGTYAGLAMAALVRMIL